MFALTKKFLFPSIVGGYMQTLAELNAELAQKRREEIERIKAETIQELDLLAKKTRSELASLKERYDKQHAEIHAEMQQIYAPHNTETETREETKKRGLSAIRRGSELLRDLSVLNKQMAKEKADIEANYNVIAMKIKATFNKKLKDLNAEQEKFTIEINEQLDKIEKEGGATVVVFSSGANAANGIQAASLSGTATNNAVTTAATITSASSTAATASNSTSSSAADADASSKTNNKF